MSKEEKYLDFGLVEYAGLNCWNLFPLPGNKVTQTVVRQPFGWSCTCQGFHVNKCCSHIRAVELWLQMSGDQMALMDASVKEKLHKSRKGVSTPLKVKE